MIFKIEKFIGFALMRFAALIKPGYGTAIGYILYKRWGMTFNGRPNYISTRSWFDGSDYSRIHLSEGCTISSGVSFLTHDWSPHTIAKSVGVFSHKPIGNFGEIHIGEYSFIGRGVTLLPGSKIGAGCLIGAGAVVRGEIPSHSVVIGNPAKIVGDSREFLERKTGIDFKK